VSLFAGIGGFDLGFERAGMRCVAQVEIDPFCRCVLAKHWPNVARYGDIRDVGKGRKYQLPSADVICGGFPCQPHSIAGKRRGAADDRDLWTEYRRIVDEYRPTWVIGENVLGIRTTILDQVLTDLESMDYSTVTLDLPACAFGAPHRRERIFIVAHANSKSGVLSISKDEEEGVYLGGVGKVWDATYANGKRLAEREAQPRLSPRSVERASLGDGGETHQWETEPGICRVVDGFPGRVDRVRALGNAVVPQVAEFIGIGIVQVMKGEKNE
jgi:DNA (cytosine-5)-methyltransferase 1